MKVFERKMCAWGGFFFVALLGIGLLIADFIPPPSPALGAEEITAFYAARATAIRVGMLLSLLGVVGYTMMVAGLSSLLRRMQGVGTLPSYLQLGAGSIGVLAIMFPIMVFAIAAFRTDRDPQIVLMLNDVGWLILVPAFPTFVAQFIAIALGIFQDTSPIPVFPRWAGFYNAWTAVPISGGAFSFFFQTGPFAWHGLIAFWIAAGFFVLWILVMSWLMLKTPDDGSQYPNQKY